MPNASARATNSTNAPCRFSHALEFHGVLGNYIKMAAAISRRERRIAAAFPSAADGRVLHARARVANPVREHVPVPNGPVVAWRADALKACQIALFRHSWRVRSPRKIKRKDSIMRVSNERPNTPSNLRRGGGGWLGRREAGQVLRTPSSRQAAYFTEAQLAMAAPCSSWICRTPQKFPCGRAVVSDFSGRSPNSASR